MNFWSGIKASFARFMQGRYGMDNLGMLTLVAGLAVSLAGSLFGVAFLSLPGLVLYGITVFRMFSRNREKRMAENRKYLAFSSGWKTKIRQFFIRCRNRKEYRYFRCPYCKVLLREKRGAGERDITCIRCSHQFHRKA